MLRLCLALLLLAPLTACQRTPAPAPPGPQAAAVDSVAAAPTLRHDAPLDSVFAGVPGAFIVLDAARHDTLRYGDTEGRTLPASTYKIPHTLLALESGIAPDTNLAIAYDRRRDPRQRTWPAGWAQDQTLGTAFRRSVVWYYQELARRIGRDPAQHWLDTLGYGSKTMGPEVDRYWLDNSLQISPEEQVALLDRLFQHRLPASEAHQDVVITFMKLDAGPDWTVYGKTGTGDDEAGAPVQWLVGAAQRGAAVYPYALRVRPGAGKAGWDRPERLARVERLLRAAGVLP